MQHVRTCPHDCPGCKAPASRWNMHMEAWKNGGCLVCGMERDGTAYACNACWGMITPEEQQEAMEATKHV
jgi:hypothetical protein